MKNFFLVSFILLSLISLGQDKEAQELIKKTADKYSNSFSVEFKMEHEVPGEKENIVQHGRLKMKGYKYHLVIDENVLLSNQVNLWYYNASLNEVQINNSIELSTEGIITPQYLQSSLETGQFSCLLSEKYQQGNTIISVVEFIPTSGDSEIFKYKLHVNDYNEVFKIQSFSKDGIRSHLHIANTSFAKLEDAEFQFEKSDFPEDVFIEDLSID